MSGYLGSPSIQELQSQPGIKVTNDGRYVVAIDYWGGETDANQ